MNPLPIIPFAYQRSIAEIEAEQVEAERKSAVEAFKLASRRLYSDICPHCGDRAVDDLITCGKTACREHEGNTASVAAFGGGS